MTTHYIRCNIELALAGIWNTELSGYCDQQGHTDGYAYSERTAKNIHYPGKQGHLLSFWLCYDARLYFCKNIPLTRTQWAAVIKQSRKRFEPSDDESWSIWGSYRGI